MLFTLRSNGFQFLHVPTPSTFDYSTNLWLLILPRSSYAWRPIKLNPTATLSSLLLLPLVLCYSYTQQHGSTTSRALFGFFFFSLPSTQLSSVNSCFVSRDMQEQASSSIAANSLPSSSERSSDSPLHLQLQEGFHLQIEFTWSF